MSVYSGGGQCWARLEECSPQDPQLWGQCSLRIECVSLLPSTVLTSTCGPRSGGVRVNPRSSSGAVLPVWVEEGLLVRKGEGADVGLVWLELMCPILLEAVWSCVAWHQTQKALSVTGRPQGDLLLWFLFALPSKRFASCRRSRQDGSEKNNKK